MTTVHGFGGFTYRVCRQCRYEQTYCRCEVMMTTRELSAKLLEHAQKIARWRENDDGYDRAIDLICEAEDLLRQAAVAGGVNDEMRR